MKKLPYSEGTLFAVPLECGGYGVGLITRMTSRARVLLCYFFGPFRVSVPDLADLSSLHPEDAVESLMIGDLSLYRNEWPIIGKLPTWNRSEWPVPIFVRRDKLSEKAWLVYYSDEDPNAIEKEEPAPYPSAQYPTDCMYGSGAVEVVLAKLLCKAE